MIAIPNNRMKPESLALNERHAYLVDGTQCGMAILVVGTSRLSGREWFEGVGNWKGEGAGSIAVKGFVYFSRS